MLDGALAVPCNLKSALAGFNSEGRVLLLLFNLVLLTKTPSGSLNSSSKTQSVLDKASKPIGEILLKVLILCSDICC